MNLSNTHKYLRRILNREPKESEMAEMRASFSNDVNYIINGQRIEILEKFARFLETNGYIDTDWKNEWPYAIDEFLKTLKTVDLWKPYDNK